LWFANPSNVKTGPHSDYIQLWRGDDNLLHESLEADQQTAVVILGELLGHCPDPAAAAAVA
jgi:hypothetical protein